MELDLTNNDRSYLFGRLLAVYEAAEKSTYTKDDERTPNALKLQPAFVSHPLFIWHSLEDKMAPYFNKMNPAKRAYYKTKIGDIVSLFKDSDRPQMNRPLAADYLLGYYLQRKDLIFTGRTLFGAMPPKGQSTSQLSLPQETQTPTAIPSTETVPDRHTKASDRFLTYA